MKTVFDYDITDEERRNIGISDKYYLAFTFIDEISTNAEYTEKLPLNLKWDFYRMITHP